MSKSKSTPGASSGAKDPTGTIRVSAEVARMLGIISTATGESVAEIATPILLPAVRKRYAQVAKQINEEIRSEE